MFNSLKKFFGKLRAGFARIETVEPVVGNVGEVQLFLDAARFPPEFDPAFYKKRNRDLRHMHNQELANHYKAYGRPEGRYGSAAVPRENFLALIPIGKSILEIGPFAKPTVQGANVKYFDVMDQSGLIARANEIGISSDNVPLINYVSPLGDLSVVGKKFECVVSSHCIEHQPDLIRHLNQIENILTDEGHYFALLPDKRYCFDHFLADSTIAEVLEAHHLKRTVHTLASVIEHRALTTHNDPLRHWNNDHGSEPYSVDNIRGAINEFGAAVGRYIDVHSWQFTPQSFRKIIQLAYELSLTKLYPVRVYDTPYGSNEFYAILQKR